MTSYEKMEGGTVQSFQGWVEILIAPKYKSLFDETGFVILKDLIDLTS